MINSIFEAILQVRFFSFSCRGSFYIVRAFSLTFAFQCSIANWQCMVLPFIAQSEFLFFFFFNAVTSLLQSAVLVTTECLRYFHLRHLSLDRS